MSLLSDDNFIPIKKITIVRIDNKIKSLIPNNQAARFSFLISCFKNDNFLASEIVAFLMSHLGNSFPLPDNVSYRVEGLIIRIDSIKTKVWSAVV